jgi:hypothetical protein
MGRAGNYEMSMGEEAYMEALCNSAGEEDGGYCLIIHAKYINAHQCRR